MSNLIPILTGDSGFYRYLQQVNKIPSLTQEEEFLLSKAYLEQNDLKAAHRLVTSHLKLVAKIATKYRNYGLPITELISEGNIGLMQAVKKFNPDFGFRLSTYSMCWIKASIQEYILKSWSLVKIGTTVAQKKLFFNLNKLKRKLTNLYSRNLTDEDFPEIARMIGVDKGEVKEMNKRMSGRDLSLNSTYGFNESNAELIELLPENRANQEVALSNRQDITYKLKLLSEAKKILKDRELDIFSQRKLADTPSTLEKLSEQYNISKERVRQIENKSFEKIKKFIIDKISSG